MKLDILTLFPAMFSALTDHSILARAIANDYLSITTHDIREYAQNKHKQADDYPYGGGAGMVMMAEPILNCMDSISMHAGTKRIYLSPRGRILTTSLAQELAQESHLLLLCGHYEGVDERVLSHMDEQISVGDYILTGGELPAMILVDALSRFIPGVLGSDESTIEESFSDGLLEYPQYTRPAVVRDQPVPDILLSGHHANILAWRQQQSLLLTAKYRSDLIQKKSLSKEDRDFLQGYGFDFPE